MKQDVNGLQDANGLQDVKRVDTTKNIQELRNRVSNHFANGSYAIKICQNCGSFWTSPTGPAEAAKILSSCKNCQENK